MPTEGQAAASGPATVSPSFPPVETALAEPNGLLALGGRIDRAWLLSAYASGIFPWYAEGEPIAWWSPDPRAVFATATLKPNARARRSMAASGFIARADRNFDGVIRACASESRPGQRGTWITTDMIDAYCNLHRSGHAHSVEVEVDGELVGALYGVSIGKMFFGESMFSRRSGASKFALYALADFLSARGAPWIDGQVKSPHLTRLGAQQVPRNAFVARVAELVKAADGLPEHWAECFGDRRPDQLLLRKRLGTGS